MNSRQSARPESEEPELNNERDIPTEDAAEDEPREQRETIAGRESVAGEEDPGAALDAELDAPDAAR